MKRFHILLLCIFAAVFAACEKDGAEGSEMLALPHVTEAYASSANITCRTAFTEEELSTAEVVFMFASIENGVLGAYEGFVPNCSVADGVLSGRLEGLQPLTVYLLYVVVVTETRHAQSKPISFCTGLSDGSDPDPDVMPAFGAPAFSDVTQTSATISCSFNYTGDKPIAEVYFLYNSPTGGEQRVAVSTATGGKSVQLTDLSPSTEYTFSLCVTIGTRTYSAAKKTFTTESIPVVAGKARYSGWAELPGEQNKPGDYYYAYHMRADAKNIRNYSVCYSASMHCAIWTAMPMHECYIGGTKRTDRWQYDPEISSALQPNLKSSYKPSGNYSRGHMVASNERTVSVATNEQTFYYTNMSPQIQNGFNGGFWGTLEGLCDKEMCSDTLYVVTGSYFGNTNTTCMDQDGKTVVVPTHFYKVLIRSKSGNTKKPLWELPADQIQCAGWWLEHKVYSGAKLKDYIKSVADIEAITGQKFFPNVPNAPKDTFNASDWKM